MSAGVLRSGETSAGEEIVVVMMVVLLRLVNVRGIARPVLPR